MATENDVQQTLSDIPTWLFVLVSMAGLSGELWRAEAAGLTVSDLLKRVLLRSGASVVFGLASVLLATASGAGCRLPPRSVAWSRASAPTWHLVFTHVGLSGKRAVLRCRLVGPTRSERGYHCAGLGRRRSVLAAARWRLACCCVGRRLEPHGEPGESGAGRGDRPGLRPADTVHPQRYPHPACHLAPP